MTERGLIAIKKAAREEAASAPAMSEKLKADTAQLFGMEYKEKYPHKASEAA